MLIVGYDPGARKQGIAIINSWGSLVYSCTLTGKGLQDIIALIKQFGRPVIVAGDRRHIEAVRKLATALGAITFFPSENLRVKDKKALTKGYAVSSVHERDALAAALMALKAYRKLIEKVRKRETEIFLGVLKGRYPNIGAALKASEKEKKKEKRKKDTEKAELYKKIAELKSQIKKLEEKKVEKKVIIRKVFIDRVIDERLKAENELLKAKIKSLLKEIEKLKEEKAMLSRKLEELRKKRKEKEKGREEKDILEIIEDYKRRYST